MTIADEVRAARSRTGFRTQLPMPHGARNGKAAVAILSQVPASAIPARATT